MLCLQRMEVEMGSSARPSTAIFVRPAWSDEGPALSALAMEAKAHWGYDDEFLEQCRSELTITYGKIGRQRVRVAEVAGEIAGFSALKIDEGSASLEYLFIHPRYIGMGLGHRLVGEDQAGAQARFLIQYVTSSGSPKSNVMVTLRVEDTFGQYLFSLSTHFTGDDFREIPPIGAFLCQIPSLPLVAGRYRVYLSVYVTNSKADALENALEFTVTESDVFGSGRVPKKGKHGPFWLKHTWTMEHVNMISTAASVAALSGELV